MTGQAAPGLGFRGMCWGGLTGAVAVPLLCRNFLQQISSFQQSWAPDSGSRETFAQGVGGVCAPNFLQNHRLL